MSQKMGFAYDENSSKSWKRNFINLLMDLKEDRLTDEDIAEAFADFNLSEEDFKELMNLFESAFSKMQDLVWVDKKTMAEHLQISEKTLERFKSDYEDKLTINVTHKKLDGKTFRYHTRNFAIVYHKVKDQSDWENIISPKSKKP